MRTPGARATPSPTRAPPYRRRQTRERPRTLTGDTFADGTYQLTAWTEYGTSSAGSTTNREISGNVMQGVATPNGVGQPELHFTATLTTSGSNLVTLDLTCPQVVSLTGTQCQITATGHETYDPKHNRLTVYTRLN